MSLETNVIITIRIIQRNILLNRAPLGERMGRLFGSEPVRRPLPFHFRGELNQLGERSFGVILTVGERRSDRSR